jgi:hypothetical protein
MRASVSLRVGTPVWEEEASFRGLLEAVSSSAGMADELALFTSITHSPVTLEAFRARMPIARERMALARTRGLRAGLNILTTIGHHEEDLGRRPAGAFTPMTDLRGQVSRGSFCPNDEGWRGYVRSLYEAAASSQPDFFWIDDDVRLFGHMPIGACCFCDRCLVLFAASTGRRRSREELERAFNEGSTEQALAVRKAWLEHNRRSIVGLFGLIEATVHAHLPGLLMGFMTGERPYEGYDFAEEARVLAGPGRAPVMWRPGGGFYTEDSPRDLARKSHEIGRQISALPGWVRPIQSEIENFPYQRLQKSAHTTVTEAACHIGAGCTGAAWNVFSGQQEPLDEYLPLFGALARARPFLDELARATSGSPPSGAWLAWTPDIFAGAHAPPPRRGLPSTEQHQSPARWPDAGPGPVASSSVPEIFELGIPAAYAREAASVTLLTGEMVAVADEPTLRSLLAGGVYMDAPALARLDDRGLGAQAGFRVAGVHPVDCTEELVEHELNGKHARFRRDCRQSFWHAAAYALEPVSRGAATLSRIIDYGSEEIAPCTMGVFENELGGRVCVSGYYPWRSLQNAAKSAQMRRLARWLSRDKLPGYVASFHRANLWLRVADGRVTSGLILNASLEPAVGAMVALRTKGGEVEVLDMAMGRRSAPFAATDGEYRTFPLPRLDPWSAYLVTPRP